MIIVISTLPGVFSEENCVLEINMTCSEWPWWKSYLSAHVFRDVLEGTYYIRGLGNDIDRKFPDLPSAKQAAIVLLQAELL